VLREENECLREENRHLLNCLLRMQGISAVGQPMPDARNNPRVTLRQRAGKLEADAWSRWYGNVSSISKTTQP